MRVWTAAGRIAGAGAAAPAVARWRRASRPISRRSAQARRGCAPGRGATIRSAGSICAPGLPVKVVENYAASWRKIEDPDGTQGWMQANLISDTRTAMVRGGGSVLRDSPSPGGRRSPGGWRPAWSAGSATATTAGATSTCAGAPALSRSPSVGRRAGRGGGITRRRPCAGRGLAVCGASGIALADSGPWPPPERRFSPPAPSPPRSPRRRRCTATRRPSSAARFCSAAISVAMIRAPDGADRMAERGQRRR